MHCHNTGYQGRTGIFEVLEITSPIRALITQNTSDATIRLAATEAGMRSMGEDGLQRVLEGRTTLEEVSRVVYLADQVAKICPACKLVLAHEFEYCPSCGEFVGEHCEKCHHRLHPDWTYCAFCGSDTPASRRSATGAIPSLPHKSTAARERLPERLPKAS